MKIQTLVVGCLLALGAIVQIQAQSVEELMLTGQAMIQNGAYNEAVTAFRKVVTREPDNFEAQFNLGFSYLGWGRYSNAVTELKKALSLNSRNAEVWSNLAIAYENLGKSSDAAGALQKAVDLDPQNIVARLNLGAMYANANQFAKAAAIFKQVIALDGVNQEALMNLSKCYIGLGQIAEAKQYLKQAAMGNPSNGEAHWELGNILWKKEKNLDDAIKEYQLAVKAQPTNASLYENLAFALVEKKQNAEAVEVLKTSKNYTDDILQKDKIQAQIDRIEGKVSGPAGVSGGNTKLTMKDQSGDLKKELRGDQENVQKIDTKPVDVMGDFNDLNNDEETPTLDLKSEAKKRANK
ncbi:MAG TPA: tetratricopeptide repeat protein [Chitinispirillaceae bacterium]|nr:tetratricopeptide repeat protein [Chitinispirillaceae bacterium]